MTAPTTTPSTTRTNLIGSLAVEGLGTMFLVLAIIVPAVTSKFLAAPGLTGSALCGGLMLMALVGAGAYRSGGHFNPAVTMGALFDGSIRAVPAAAYMGAQFVGGIVAAIFTGSLENRLKEANPEIDAQLAANQRFSDSVSNFEAIGFEFIATFALVWLILLAASDRRSKPQVALVAGCVLFAALLTGSLYTGAALNPARVLGPTAISGANVGWDFFLIVMLVPMFAGAAAGLANRFTKNVRPAG